MRLIISRKQDLSVAQIDVLNELIGHSVTIEGSCGPIVAWNTYQDFLYAFSLADTKIPIGIVEASGRPVCSPGWWIAPKYRGLKYGNDLVDALGPYLLQDRVSSIGPVSIQTPNHKYDDQSSKLVIRLRSYFP
ncbi:MAG: hypothetical protein WCV99_21170 [Sterolibacterium sp.]|jgi:hypothetical protein